MVKNFNIEYERAIVSTCVGKPALLSAVKKIVSSSDFFDGDLRKAFNVISTYDGPLSHATIMSELKKKYGWSPSKYTEVVNSDDSVVDYQVTWYASEVKRLSVERNVLVKIGQVSIDISAGNADIRSLVKELSDYVESKVTAKQSHLPLRSISTEYKLREWWIDGLVPKNACLFIGGAPKSSKTYFIFDLILSAITGYDFLPSDDDGFRVQSKVNSVLISSTEGDEICTDNRLHRLCWCRGIDIGEVRKHMHFIDCGFNLANKSDYNRYIDTIKYTNADLIILDPYIKLVQGIESNNDMEVQRVLDGIRASIKYGAEGCSLIVVHHIKKAANESQYDLRGSGALDGWHDGKISLVRSTKKEHGADVFSMSAYYRDGRGRPKIDYQLVDVVLSEEEIDLYNVRHLKSEIVNGIRLERITRETDYESSNIELEIIEAIRDGCSTRNDIVKKLGGYKQKIYRKIKILEGANMIEINEKGEISLK